VTEESLAFFIAEGRRAVEKETQGQTSIGSWGREGGGKREKRALGLLHYREGGKKREQDKVGGEKEREEGKKGVLIELHPSQEKKGEKNQTRERKCPLSATMRK